MRQLRLTLLTILTLLAIKSFSCTYQEIIKDKKLIENSDYAFIAEVLSNVFKDAGSGAAMAQMGIRPDARVRIIKWIKGTFTDKEVIVISSESSSCEINLIPGKKYLITGKTTPLNLPLTNDSSIESPPTVIAGGSFQISPFKTREQWINEFREKYIVIFTSVCESRQKK